MKRRVRNITIKIAVIMAAAFGLFPVHASEYLFSTISLDDGLSQTTARSVLRDKYGYLWIGTKSGLNRYDAGKTVNYYNDPEDDNSIPDNDVVDIFDDEIGNVWVVCEKGVAVYDRLHDRFDRVELNGKPLRIRSHYKNDEGILLGGGGQLFFYDFDGKDLHPVSTSGGSNRFYTGITEWGRGRYVLATRWDGLWIYDESSGRINRIGFCPDSNIMTAVTDSEGNLWVSPYGEGLRCYDRTGRCIRTVGAELLGSGIVLDLLNTDSALWVATDGGGVHRIDPLTHNVSPIKGAEDRRQRGLRSVTKLYRDDFGYVYAGTVRDGLTCITESPMRTYLTIPGAEGTAVTALFADGDKIWIGADGGGVVCYEPKTDRFTPIASTSAMKIASMENYDSDRMLLSTFGSGFYLLDKKKNVISRAPAAFDELVKVNAKKALPLDVRRISDDCMAVLSDRIYLYDMRRDKWQEINATRVTGHLNDFYTDFRIMLCFSEGEIVLFDIPTRTVKTLATVPERTIACAVYDGNRYVYIGTASGIKCLDMETGQIGQMENDTPLPPRVTSLIIDSDRMWIGAGGGVYLKDLQTGRFCKFDRYDGVAPNEFIYKANLATPTQMYMGGVNGLLKIDRTRVPGFVAHKTSIPVTATDVEADGMVLASLDSEGHYDVPYEHSSVSMRVTGGDPHPLRQSPFRFFINSPDGDGAIESNGNTITINRLTAGGRYDIYASAIAPDGSWSSPRRVAILRVQRPWWKSPLAVVFYVVAGLGALILLLFYLRRRKKRSMAMKAQETQRRSLEKEVGFLMEMNHELRTPLTLIYARLKDLIERLNNHNASEPMMLDELDNIYRSTRKMRDIINTTVDQWYTTENSDHQASEGVAAPTVPPELPAASDTATVDTSDMTVIIAEEDPDLCEYIAESLRPMFGKVVKAADGKDALTEVKNNNPDLIITDAHLPSMSGTELCHHVKRLDEFSHIPVIMLTARIEDMNLRAGHDLGADVYITKPFDMKQLAGRCRTVLRSFERVKLRYKGQAADILQRENYNNESETFLLKIKEVIENNISQPGFGVEMIVDKMLMSRSSLYSKFKELTGQSLGTYIEDYRVGRAREMLSDTDMTMNEISDALGFSTQRYFSTFFKKKTGISPTQYRADHSVRNQQIEPEQ